MPRAIIAGGASQIDTTIVVVPVRNVMWYGFSDFEISDELFQEESGAFVLYNAEIGLIEGDGAHGEMCLGVTFTSQYDAILEMFLHVFENGGNNEPWVYSFYAKSAGEITTCYMATTNDGVPTAWQEIILTPNWQRFVMPFIQNTNGFVSLRIAGSEPGQIRIDAVQAELGEVATEYQVGGSSEGPMLPDDIEYGYAGWVNGALVEGTLQVGPI